MNKITTVLVAIGAAVAMFTFSASAQAGTYTITQAPCQGSGWTWGGQNVWGFAISDSCAGHVGVDGTNSPGGVGFAYWKSPILPDHAYFSSGTVYGLLRYTTGSRQAYIRSCTRAGYSAGGFGSCGGDAISYPAVPSNTWGWYAPYLGAPNVAALQVDLNRAEVGGFAGINYMNMTATESVAPVIDRAVGGVPMWYPYGQWNNNGWHRGVKNMRFTSTDTGGFGVKEQRYLIDGGTVNGGVTLTRSSAAIGCTLGNWYPCPTSTSWLTDWNTADVSGGVLDGPHTLVLQTTDAADNVSNSASYGFNVDNTAPSEPSEVEGEGSSGNSWSATNDFDIDWTNATETVQTTTQSGITHVALDIAPVDSGAADPAVVVVPVGETVSGISATLDSLTGITLPEVGEYRLGVGVRDLAGNWSGNVAVDSNNNPTGVTVDETDPSVGYDPTPPTAPNGQANGWISRAELASGYSQEWSINRGPSELAPICGFAGKISLASVDDPGTAINIPGDVREWQLPTNLSENNHWVHLRSVSCAGLASPTVEKVEAKVDLTDPTPNYSGVEEGRWYRDGKVVILGGADALSGMAAAPALDPYNHGAYIDYTINGVAPTTIPRGGSAQVSVTGEGQKELVFTPVDFAGNRATNTTLRFGIDATNPTGHFVPRDPERPTLLSAPIGDSTSGIEQAVIEVRLAGSGDAWKILPTGLADLSGNAVAGNPTSAIASARFPDTSLPRGTYQARVRTYDQAGNELATSKLANGSDFTFTNPMRDGVSLSAGLFKAKRTCKKKKGVKCIKKHRGKVVFTGAKPTLAVAYKRGAVVQGFLATSKYASIARQPIEIYTTAKGKPEQLVGTTSTRADGSYVFKLKPGVSRKVRVYYPGTELREDASAIVNLGTGAKLKLRTSKKRARTGQTVIFRGTVTSYDRAVPAAGKIIALQFYAGKKWRPAVAIARTDSKGRFAVKYKFDRISKGVRARIVFRVIAPAEDGWGHATSASRRVTMRLN